MFACMYVYVFTYVCLCCVQTVEIYFMHLLNLADKLA